MIKCDICGKELKNANGLRLHMKKHRNDPKPEEPKIEEVIANETGLSEGEQPTDNFTAPFRIKLWDNEDVMILEYPVFGKQALEEAKENAKKRGYKIEIKQTIIS